jgi:dienelactone hydrolase
MTYSHLGAFSNLVEKVREIRSVPPQALPGRETQQAVQSVLGFAFEDESPIEPTVETSWESEDVEGKEISWSVGYGPRTKAWLLLPRTTARPLAGVLALHDHGDFKYFGKEKIADGPQGSLAAVSEHRKQAYSGVAFANRLAQRGYAVLAHDTFLWGSRRFPLEVIPERERALAKCGEEAFISQGFEERLAEYNAAAELHEHLVEKYCSLLGTTMAGVVSYEDRVALNFLASLPEVDAARLGCIGLSGGGNRAALLTATHERLSAAVIVGMMSTYEGLLDSHVASHTWMLYPAGWARHGEWPDLAACRAPRPLLVQFDSDDELFDLQGMEDADDRLRELYRLSGYPENYLGQFYPGPHKFDLEMQESAFAWLDQHLGHHT